MEQILRPSIYVGQLSEADNTEIWRWTIEKIDENNFVTKFDDVAYVYPLESIEEVICLIATDHVRRHRADENMVIDSNVGFTTFECKGRDVHKHIKHSIILLKYVMKIEKHSKLYIDYLS